MLKLMRFCRFGGHWLLSHALWLLVWTLLMLAGSVPVLCLGILMTHSFNDDLLLPEKAIVACAGIIALVISCAKTLYGDVELPRFRRSVGLFFVSIFGLCGATALKIALFHYWKGGFDRKDFSPDFDLAPSNFAEAFHKPHAWLVVLLYVSLVGAYFAFVLGTWQFLLIAFPSLSRIHRWMVRSVVT